jgi:DNA-binding MarR family transcriptional regulator
MTSRPARHPVAALPWPADTTQAPVRGQLAILVLARGGRVFTDALAEALANPDLAGNVPLLVLCELSIRGPLRPRDLLEPTSLNSAALSKHLDHMEALGLITRTYGTVAGDRRGSIVELTAHGHEAARTIGWAVEERIEDIRAMRDGMSRLLGD